MSSVLKRFGMFNVDESTKITLNFYALIAVIVAVVSFAFTVGIWKNGVESDLSNIRENAVEHDHKIESIESDVSEIKENVAWIRGYMEKENNGG